jgi:hypothetical protein
MKGMASVVKTIDFDNHAPVKAVQEIAWAPLSPNISYQRAYIHRDVSGILHLWKFFGSGLSDKPLKPAIHVYDTTSKDDLIVYLRNLRTANPSAVLEWEYLQKSTIDTLLEKLNREEKQTWQI